MLSFQIEMISTYSFEEVWFLEESYENMQKIQIWKFRERPLFEIGECTFKYALLPISEWLYFRKARKIQ